MAPPLEWMKFAAAPRLGLEALHARYVTHEYERHAHDFYVIGTVDRGAAKLSHGSQQIVAPAETVLIINPGVSHDGKPADEAGYLYSMVYIDRAVVDQLGDELGLQGSTPVDFAQPVLSDKDAVERVRLLHQALFGTSQDLTRDLLLLDALKHLIVSYSGGRAKPESFKDWRIRRVRDFIHANYSESFTTSDLATVSGLSRSQLNQLFRHGYGLPLHAYLNGVRLEAAKALLLGGMGGAEAAATVGLSDQSHLSRMKKEGPLSCIRPEPSSEPSRHRRSKRDSSIERRPTPALRTRSHSLLFSPAIASI